MSNRKSQYSNIFKEEVVKREDSRQFSASAREDFYRNNATSNEPSIQFFEKDDTVCYKKGNKFYYKGVS